MYLGYQDGKIKFYTEEMLNPNFYQLDKQEYTEDEYVISDDGSEFVLKDEAWEEKQRQKERERLNLLSMTKREMFLGLYQAKGITPDMLKAQITDPQALIEFEYANDYYRGNPLIDVIGGQLGFTTEMLDKFFDSKDYHYLTTCTLTVNVVPEGATVIINDVEQKQITVPYGASVDVSVECEGYVGTAYTAFLTEDRTLDIELVKEVTDEDTTDTTDSNISI